MDVIHIGYPKTGTSWLQQVIFSKNDQINYVGNGATNKNAAEEVNLLIRSLVHGSDITFNKKKFQSAIDRVLSKQSGTNQKCKMLSSEALCGDWPNGKNTKFIAHILNEIYPTAKIIIGVRNQTDMIESCYTQYIRRGGTKSIKHFLFDYYISEGYEDDTNPYSSHVINFFAYSPLINIYVDLFGKDNVLVVPNEKMKLKSNEFLEELSEFIGFNVKGIEEKERVINKKASYHTNIIIKCLNNLFATRFDQSDSLASKFIYLFYKSKYTEKYNNDIYSYIKFNQTLQKKVVEALENSIINFSNGKRFIDDFKLNDEWKILKEMYEQDNKKICNITGLDLKGYGYFDL